MRPIELNPLLVRFARSRLRWRKATFWYLLTLVVTGFMVSIILVTETQRAGVDLREAARTAVLPLIVLQGIILVFMGTGSVATGITREKVEDVLDYQRMTPMTPMRNLCGYLLGLPVREYVLFGLTLPFAVFVMVAAQLQILSVLLFYVAFLLSALLYHATGLTAGMVSRKWRWSGRLAQGIIIVMYFVLPQFSHLGIVSFEYLTVRPVLADTLVHQLYGSGEMADGLQRLVGQQVPLFGLWISGTLYSILLQLSFLLLLLSIGQRKWVDPDAPSMSKATALVVFGWLCFLVLGNLWPNLVADARSLGAVWQQTDVIDPAFLFVAFPLVLGSLLAAIGLFVLHIAATDSLRYRRGCLRVQRQGLARPGFWRDESSALWLAVIFGLLTAVLLGICVRMLGHSYPLADADTIQLGRWWVLALGVLVLMVQFVLIRELLGGERILLYQLLIWAVPLLLAALFGAASNAMGDLALWTIGISPLSLLPMGAATLGEGLANVQTGDELALNFGAARNFAFVFQLALTAVLAWIWQRRFAQLRAALTAGQ